MKHIFPALQWALFILMSSVVIPVTIAASFGLDPGGTVEFVQRSLFVLGVAGLLQTFFGHRLPIQEGPAGLWWGVFSLYAGLGTVLFGSHSETLRVLEFAFILSGLIFILLSVFGLVEKLSKLFTPAVTGIYLILMVVQLSSSFLKGMFGLSGEHPVVNPEILLLSALIIIFSYAFRRVPKVGHYSVLASIVFGWAAFAVLGLADRPMHAAHLFKLPALFAFGLPRIEAELVFMVLFITLLLLANMLATVKVVQGVLERQGIPVEHSRMRQTGIVSGINQLLAGSFSAIGPVPISGSAGFISTTRITGRLPFIIGSLVIIGISLFPPFTAFVSAIPVAVGYAAVFPVFASTISLAFQEFESLEDKSNLFQVAGISLFAGIGTMFIPTEAFSSMSPVLTSILSNGLVFGAIIAVVAERILMNRSGKAGETEKEKAVREAHHRA
ncbi:purine/pyrimidine permease [Bhargavaea cecembensis]|uniref:purine/pyrimidine permease n=1 Tax=Bhargavaea cecembensis TaxID=394098 RepID=UPI00058BCF0C|nr:purine/pyrimidine permease [Bhargavaea cecembensis]